MTIRMIHAQPAWALRLPGNGIARTWQTAARWRERRAVRRALGEPEDRIFEDIGLPRYEIDPAAGGLFRMMLLGMTL